ncbi:MAG: WecB/TagA/CpsF family glycosyltransferase [Candidatus Shapirobacteria bacterium]|nr:WecB/TagA/CpsF family glycosyltransferase [Candidatus Shapirobacteria bacterium]
MKKISENTPKKDGNSDKILEVSLVSGSMIEVTRLIEKRLENQQKTFIVTPNPEFLVFAQENPWFKRILDQADLAIPDGIALIWAKEVLKGKNFLSRIAFGFTTGFKVIFQAWGGKRVTGTDLTERLCQLAAKRGKSVYFLGGKEGKRTIKALKNMQDKYPGLKGWANPGPILTLNSKKSVLEPISQIKRIVEDINEKQPDFLFVALNMGKQEKFLADNWNQLKIKLGMGIGGAFDYLSGEIKRAPQWIKQSGFEWLYRLIKEPWRFKRQLKLWQFIWLVLTAKN